MEPTAPPVATAIAAFFDVDNTLLPGEASEVRFFRHLWRRNIVGWHELIRSAWWLARHLPACSLQPLRERKLYLAGKSAQEIESLAESYCRDTLIPALSRDGLGVLDWHRQAGHHIVFVTGAPDFLIAPIARLLDISTLFAATLERVGRTYSGALSRPLPYGPGKRELILKFAADRGIDLSASFGYGDSPGDEDVLQLVGHPLVVNPIRGMDRIARRRRWSVTSWT
jgi:HAD superfamily hydrolase (TIGR01490 family)